VTILRCSTASRHSPGRRHPVEQDPGSRPGQLAESRAGTIRTLPRTRSHGRAGHGNNLNYAQYPADFLGIRRRGGLQVDPPPMGRVGQTMFEQEPGRCPSGSYRTRQLATICDRACSLVKNIHQTACTLPFAFLELVLRLSDGDTTAFYSLAGTGSID